MICPKVKSLTFAKMAESLMAEWAANNSQSKVE
jgi:hypothetical protein